MLLGGRFSLSGASHSCPLSWSSRRPAAPGTAATQPGTPLASVSSFLLSPSVLSYPDLCSMPGRGPGCTEGTPPPHLNRSARRSSQWERVPLQGHGADPGTFVSPTPVGHPPGLVSSCVETRLCWTGERGGRARTPRPCLAPLQAPGRFKGRQEPDAPRPSLPLPGSSCPCPPPTSLLPALPPWPEVGRRAWSQGSGGQLLGSSPPGRAGWASHAPGSRGGRRAPRSRHGRCGRAGRSRSRSRAGQAELQPLPSFLPASLRPSHGARRCTWPPSWSGRAASGARPARPTPRAASSVRGEGSRGSRGGPSSARARGGLWVCLPPSPPGPGVCGFAR